MTNVPPPPPPVAPPKGRPVAPKRDTTSVMNRLLKKAQVDANPAYIWTVIGVEGWGKTSLGAFIPDVMFVSAGTETGYQSLLNAGRVPSVTHAHCDEWNDVLDLATAWAVNTEYPRVSCWDCGGSLQQLCQEHVIATEFGGEREKFAAFGRGLDAVSREWVQLLKQFEIAKASGKDVVLLVHSQVKTFNDPMLLEPYDRYIADLDKRVWGSTHRVSDEVLFCTFLSDVKKDKGDLKAKGVGGKQRVIYTQRCDAYDAKDRLGLPEFIVAPDDPSQVWSVIQGYVKKGM